VSAADYERVRDELAQALLEFSDPDTGARPIGRVVRKEDVLEDGPFLERAPDLLLEPAPLYSLTHARRLVEPADWLSGDHRREGIAVLAGPGVEPGRGERVALSDYAAIVSEAVGVDPAPGMRRAGAGTQAAQDVWSAEEEREVAERLRGLGYLE
jgi:predicted AlkP superfamily phosphohydrolase/phosphomutase